MKLDSGIKTRSYEIQQGGGMNLKTQMPLPKTKSLKPRMEVDGSDDCPFQRLG